MGSGASAEEKVQGRIVVLGSGTSEGVPVASCVTKENVNCPACKSAVSSPQSKDRRRNTSLAITMPVARSLYRTQWQTLRGPESISEEATGASLCPHSSSAPSLTSSAPSVPTVADADDALAMRRCRNEATGEENGMVDNCTIVVDVGKFFWQSALDLFPAANLRHIDAILLTHSHFDAIGGFDDLRDWTKRVQLHALPVFLHPRDLAVVKQMFPYLVTANQAAGGGVSDLMFLPTIDRRQPFTIFGLEIIPLPVMHGRTYESMGFRFGDVSYVSDCSAIPDTTTELICGTRVEETGDEEDLVGHADLVARLACSRVLIIDCLSLSTKVPIHPSHFIFVQLIEYLRALPAKPPVIYLTGLTHGVVHSQAPEILAEYKEEGLNIELLYDGLEIPFHASLQ